MVHTHDHFSERLFDPWHYLEPKRRQLLARSWAGLFRAHLFTQMPVGTIAHRFAATHGRPTKELYTIIGALLLQQMHDLSDAAVIETLAFNTQWHYALDITGESDADKYLCEKTLRSYRKLLVEERLDTVLFETLTDTLLQQFALDTSHQRLDSSHICANMRRLRRLEIFTRTVTKFLKTLTRSFPALLETLVDRDLHARYLHPTSDGCFSRVKPTDARRTLQQAAADVYTLVALFQSHPDVHRLSQYRMLQRVLADQCQITETTPQPRVTVKAPRDIPSDSLQNPSDPEATYDGHKGQGYQVQVMETYTPPAPEPPPESPDRTPPLPHLMTYVHVEPAHLSDDAALRPALAHTQARACAPTTVLCDTAYGSDDNVQHARRQGVEVVAPVKGPTQTPKTRLKEFTFAPDTPFVQSCPAGYAPHTVTRTKKHNLIATFAAAPCRTCPRMETCPVKVGPQGAALRYTDKQVRLAQRRAYEDTAEFRNRYRWRAGIEGSLSHLKADTGAHRFRIRGLAHIRFAVTLKALGLNIFRAAKAKAAAWAKRFLRLCGYQKHPIADQPGFQALSSFCTIRCPYFLSKNNFVYSGA